MATVEVKCRFCQQTESVRKHGTGQGERQRYRCLSCRRTFQLEYAYRACRTGIKEQVVDLAMNNAGIRDTARALHISINAVVRTFKKLSPRCVTTLPLEQVEIELICEVDEMWSFVGNKKQQRWLWYAWEPRLKRIIAHTFGRRSKKTLKKLLKKLSHFNVAFWCTDKFKAYTLLTTDKHLIGKSFTQRIERENLTLRNRIKRLNRKTLGYSKSPEMHDKVIGTFIEREYYI
ncbi:IS1 family transposase [Xenorhabdus griffiniae]|uniref:IS1 family transposase n=1 Tax=Xenorhabdus griffiniae TaxID=351672 RepID=A0ABY9XHW5_9GAMM|nr:IS1 family transposase [Xenorhabdus griffiniae]WMV72050.1 IS1 family transposase [Xenorhabdus griffiniae]WMV72472.1 IS1 family transposase [Xenorhabdus griffiniae]WNH01728.1 IS1 family transposase [Xenorhabdus griffiniae]WNH02150.1 IS1 family transposase [Xenorhabdus griffiniae]